MKKPLFTHVLLLVLVGLLALVIAGCQASTPQPTATEAVPTTPVQPTDTFTPAPSATVTATEIPSETPTPTAIPATATPSIAFDQAKIIGVTQQLNGVSTGSVNVQLVIAFPGIQQAYNVVLNKVNYYCSVVASVPDRLFCNGLVKPKGDQSLSLDFTDVNSGAVLYSTEVSIPSAYIPTDIPAGDTGNWCPDRGKNEYCEYECRIAPDGSACLVASCYDACGYYFSIDSCPADLHQPFTYCSDAVIAQMKAKYNIP